jgi:hypothetical protein
MIASTSDLERPMLRMGSVAFLAGIVIFLVSTILHPSREDPTNHPLVFAEYAQDKFWIASHIGQFAGGMLAFAGGFVALFRLLHTRSESAIASALAWMGLAATIAAGSALPFFRLSTELRSRRQWIRGMLFLLRLVVKKQPSPFELQKGLGGLRLQPIAYSEFFKAQLE